MGLVEPANRPPERSAPRESILRQGIEVPSKWGRGAELFGDDLDLDLFPVEFEDFDRSHRRAQIGICPSLLPDSIDNLFRSLIVDVFLVPDITKLEFFEFCVSDLAFLDHDQSDQFQIDEATRWGKEGPFLGVVDRHLNSDPEIEQTIWSDGAREDRFCSDGSRLSSEVVLDQDRELFGGEFDQFSRPERILESLANLVSLGVGKAERWYLDRLRHEDGVHRPPERDHGPDQDHGPDDAETSTAAPEGEKPSSGIRCPRFLAVGPVGSRFEIKICLMVGISAHEVTFRRLNEAASYRLGSLGQHESWRSGMNLGTHCFSFGSIADKNRNESATFPASRVRWASTVEGTPLREFTADL